jgi:hypothetical protein
MRPCFGWAQKSTPRLQVPPDLAHRLRRYEAAPGQRHPDRPGSSLNTLNAAYCGV